LYELTVYYNFKYIGLYRGEVVIKNFPRFANKNKTYREDVLKKKPIPYLHGLMGGRLLIPNGQGLLSDGDENTFEGKFHLGQFIFGEIKYPNGAVYRGDVKDGNPNGKGFKHFPNGNIYEGDFKNGLPHGQGIITYSDGDIYRGNFKHGLPSGYGRYDYDNGDSYDGFFRYGEPNGRGEIRFADGQTKKGLFVNGEFQI